MKTLKVLRPADLALLAALAITFALPACSIQHKEDADKKNVKIETPFGNMQVKADDKKPADTGLSQYPNAHLKEKGNDNDSHNANVDMNFGPFGMKVVAATYVTDDSSKQVLEYYRKEMAKYGRVIECNGGIDDKNDELVCSSKHGDNDVELGVGNKMRRRIVAVKDRAGKTEFSLVYLQLRGDNNKEGEL